MFDGKNLTFEQEKIISKVLANVSACDGIDDQERDLFNSVFAKNNLEFTIEELAKEPIDFDEIRENIPSDLFKDLVQACWFVTFADSVVSEKEVTLLNKICTELNVDISQSRADAMNYLLKFVIGNKADN